MSRLFCFAFVISGGVIGLCIFSFFEVNLVLLSLNVIKLDLIRLSCHVCSTFQCKTLSAVTRRGPPFLLSCDPCFRCPPFLLSCGPYSL